MIKKWFFLKFFLFCDKSLLITGIHLRPISSAVHRLKFIELKMISKKLCENSSCLMLVLLLVFPPLIWLHLNRSRSAEQGERVKLWSRFIKMNSFAILSTDQAFVFFLTQIMPKIKLKSVHKQIIKNYFVFMLHHKPTFMNPIQTNAVGSILILNVRTTNRI